MKAWIATEKLIPSDARKGNLEARLGSDPRDNKGVHAVEGGLIHRPYRLWYEGEELPGPQFVIDVPAAELFDYGLHVVGFAVGVFGECHTDRRRRFACDLAHGSNQAG